MPHHVREPEYPSDYLVRRVQTDGEFGWKATNLRVGKVLAQQPVGLHATDDDE